VGRSVPSDDPLLSGSALRFEAADETHPTITPDRSPSAVNPFFRTFMDANANHGNLIGLGDPTAAATHYTATLQESYNDALTSAVIYLTLPDGRVLRYLESIYTASWAIMPPDMDG
jgi:hypothetical protein